MRWYPRPAIRPARPGQAARRVLDRQGVRRVEALVGIDAFRFLAREHVLVEQLTETLKVRPEELPDRVGALLEQLREAQRDLARLRQSRLLAGAADLARGARDVFGVAYVGHHAPTGQILTTCGSWPCRFARRLPLIARRWSLSPELRQDVRWSW